MRNDHDNQGRPEKQQSDTYLVFAICLCSVALCVVLFALLYVLLPLFGV